MGTSFVTLGRDEAGEQTSEGDRETGFWMHDWMLELWLRLLVLNVEEPAQGAHTQIAIRNQWLLASGAGFGGCVPHGLEEATATPEGFNFVRSAVTALSNRLSELDQPLPTSALNLLGLGKWSNGVAIEDLRDVASAFIDLLDFKVSSTASTKRQMPGTRERPGAIH